jgi:ankyrin repeat protein
MKPILRSICKNLFYIVGCTIVGFAVFAKDGTLDFYYSVVKRQEQFCQDTWRRNSVLPYRYVKRGFPTTAPQVIEDPNGEVTSEGHPGLVRNWPLACAANSYPDLQRYMIYNGENVKRRGPYGYTALHYAKYHSSCLALLEAGAEVNALGGLNATPLDAAPLYFADTIEVLLDHGARKCVGYIKERSQIETRCSYAPSLTFRDDTPVFAEFLKKYQQDPKYNRLMTETETVDAILSEIFVPDRSQLSDTDKETIAVLLDFHPTLDGSKSSDGRSLLIRICDRLGPNGYDPELDAAIVTKAIKLGAEVNRQNPYDGSTALHYAVRCHSYGAVKALLAHGADPNIRDQQGHKPEDLLSGIEDYLK